MLSHLALFTNFYKHTYNKKLSGRNRNGTATENGMSTENGNMTDKDVLKSGTKTEVKKTQDKKEQ